MHLHYQARLEYGRLNRQREMLRRALRMSLGEDTPETQEGVRYEHSEEDQEHSDPEEAT